MALPLEVLADLRLTVDGEAIDVRGEGHHLVVDLPSLRAGRRLVTSGPFVLGNREEALTRLHEALDVGGVSAEIRLQGTRVARMGAGARPGMLSRVLSLGPVEVQPARPALQAIRRRPLLTALVLAGLVGLVGWLFVRGGGNE